MTSGFWQKIGFWPKELRNAWESKKDWLWFHAVSVGELNAIWPLILNIHHIKPNYPIMISCTTNAAYNLAHNLSKDKNFQIFYFPFDLPPILNSLTNHVRLKLLIIAETEIWPSTLGICKKNNVPVLLVNARLSDKSFYNYLLFKFYFKNVVNSFSEILTQSKSDSEKFLKLGASRDKIKTLGNIKYSTLSNNNKINDYSLRTTDVLTIVFGSTHKGEEELALNIYKNLLNDFKNIRLIIAPRHINRVPDVVSLVEENQFKPILKTQSKTITSNKEILILNTIGELQNTYKTADITVLGGTFVKVGGHNILEPIRANSYTIIGPYDFKISELTQPFKERDAIVQVKDPDELMTKLKEAITNQPIRELRIQNGRQIIKENAKVLEHITERILSYL